MATRRGDSDDGRRSTDSDERVSARCREALDLKERGEYESARRALYEWWPPEAAEPRTTGLSAHAAAELLLTAGTLVGILGSAKQVRGAQARAMKLLAESARLFEHAGLRARAAAAHSELALCRWRLGDQEGGRRLLWRAIDEMGDGAEGREAKALALLRAAAFEEKSGRLTKALTLLRESRPFFDSCGSTVLLSKFHNNLGIILRRLGEESGREDFFEQALDEYAAAGFHFEQAGATRLLAQSENNHGFVLILLGKFGEAAERLVLARDLFAGLSDAGNAAQVDETRARLLLAEGRNKESERLAAEAVRALEAGERPTLLAEALTTLGTALARVGRPAESCKALGRAILLAHNAGAREMAGAAALSAVEELCGWLNPEEAISLYEFAYERLEGARHARTLQRLSKVARAVYAPWRAQTPPPEPPRLLAEARRLSGNDSPALVTGKNADSRRLLACYAHARSGRPGPLVFVDCGVIEDESPQPDFFDRIAEEALGGTLVLDRMDELGRHLQTRLLCTLEQTLGGHPTEKPRRDRLAARIIAGTSRDLSREVALGCFDPKLFEALGGRGPYVAPSAEEVEELRLLAGCFDVDALGRLDRPHTGTPVENDDDDSSVSFDESVKNFKIELIRKALVKTGGHIGRAAQLLDMKRQTLENIIKNPKYSALQEWCAPVIKRNRA